MDPQPPYPTDSPLAPTGAPTRSPNGLKALAVIELALGALGLLTALAVAFVRPHHRSPHMHELMETGTFALWMRFSKVASIVLKSALFAAGVGVFMRRAWGRTLSLAYAVCDLAFIGLSFWANVFVVRPVMEELARSAGPSAHLAGTVGTVTAAMGGFAAGAGLLLPAALLFIMTRPSVVAEFEQQRASQAAAKGSSQDRPWG